MAASAVFVQRERKKDSAAAAAVHFAKIGSFCRFAALPLPPPPLFLSAVLTAMPTPIPITAILREGGRVNRTTLTEGEERLQKEEETTSLADVVPQSLF